MKLLEQAVMEDNLSSETLPFYLYGLYLSQGGSKEDFMNLNSEDLQLLYLAHEGDRVRFVRDMSKLIAKMFGAESA